MYFTRMDLQLRKQWKDQKIDRESKIASSHQSKHWSNLNYISTLQSIQKLFGLRTQT